MKTNRFVSPGSLYQLLAVALLVACLIDRGVASDAQPILESAGIGIHVSPTGNDDNPGTRKAPLASLDKAVELLGSKKPQAGATTIWLEDGVHHVDQTITLDEHSPGTEANPVVIRAVNPGKAILDGGTIMKASDFVAIADQKTLARIQPQAKAHMRKLDLKRHGFVHGKEFPVLFGGGAPPPLFEVYFKGKRTKMSRYPKEGWLTVKKIIDNGGGGHRGSVNLPDSVCLFEYRAPRHAKWLGAVEDGLWFQGYWRVEWQYDAIKVSNIDPEAKTVEFVKTPAGGLGNKYYRPEGSGVEMYTVLNLLEEISQPGEWSIDFANEVLYLWPPETIGDGDIIISDRKSPMLRITDASDIRFEGLTFDYNLGRGVVVEGSENIEFAGCTFRRIQGAGLTITGGTNCGIRSSDMHDLGSTCIILQNAPESARDLTPCGHFAVNNHLHHFGVNQRIYAAAVNVGFEGRLAVGMRIAHNLIHDTPHGAILYGSHKNLIEYNHMYRICQFSGDMSGIYSADFEKRKIGKSGYGDNVIRHNFEHHGLESRGIYIDFDQTNDKIYGNVLYGLQMGFLIKKGNGSPHHVVNNMAINCIHDYGVAGNKGNQFHDNLSVNCGKAIHDLFGAEMKVIDEGSDAFLRVSGDPGFVDPENLDFRLKQDSAVFEEMPDFKQIPMEKIGLYTDQYRMHLPAETHVTLGDFRKKPARLEIGDVTASSERPGFDAGNAVDGNIHTAWHPQHRALPAWIQVDLREIKPVKACRVRFGLPERFHYFYKIEYSTDGKTWNVYADHSDGDSDDWKGHTVFEDEHRVEARFLRLTLNLAKLRKGRRGEFWPMVGLRTFDIIH